jgi:hypothetical protein
MPIFRHARLPAPAPRVRPALLAMLATASLAAPSFLGIAAATAPASSAVAQAVILGARGTQQQGTSMLVMVAVRPSAVHLSDGSTRTTYSLPDGEVINSVTPPSGFSPLHATDAQLKEYDFPLPPSSPDGLSAWRTAMLAYRSDTAPTGTLQFAVKGNASVEKRVMLSTTTSYSNWGGYEVGDESVQSNTYVAVTTNFSVPTNSNTCTGSNIGAFWIGLGGTHTANSLVQQGIVCADPAVGSGSAYRPFTEFADTANPVALCGESSWTLPAGHVIYQQMSYEASNKIANFYLEDETSGTTHSCSKSPPSGWSYDDNTAEWIGEATTGTAVHFSAVHFTSSEAELGSSGSWVTISSQGTIWKDIAGKNGTTYCISPGSISGGTAFTDTWHEAACY